MALWLCGYVAKWSPTPQHTDRSTPQLASVHASHNLGPIDFQKGLVASVFDLTIVRKLRLFDIWESLMVQYSSVSVFLASSEASPNLSKTTGHKYNGMKNLQ